MNVILSIHPKWATLIYSGKKTIEWRKNLPLSITKGDTVFLYESAPVQKITGSFVFGGQYFFEPNDKNFIEHYKSKGINIVELGCVPLEDLRKYADVHIFGWDVKNPRKFGTPKPIEDFGLKRPPQSWCYTEVDYVCR